MADVHTTIKDITIKEGEWANPMGTDGFEFVEFASKKPRELEDMFLMMGFKATARHKSKNVTLFQQGHINFVLNEEPNSHAAKFSETHGPCVCAMAFRVKDAMKAYDLAVSLGAKPFEGHTPKEGELHIPAIYGIGDSLLYFVDLYGDQTIYQQDFTPIEGARKPSTSPGLSFIDHLTHNVYQGNMDQWAKFYETIFNFKEIRYFDIDGKMTGLTSRALSSPCGKIKIPLNQSKDDKSQIEEYLREYQGEGIQHIALYTDDIYHTVETMRDSGVRFLTVPDTYYELLDKRVPGHGEDVARLEKNRILIDGAPLDNQGLLLQIFTENMIGPIFFEIIQRRSNQGFGEGNFTALFESIELDQVRRGVLKEDDK